MKGLTREKDGTVSVRLAKGSPLTARSVVVATEGPSARQLLGAALEAAPSKQQDGVGTCCLYFRSDVCVDLRTSDIRVLT